MPRYDDRYGGNTRLYVGRLSSRTRTRDLEDIFGKYGRVRDVDMKHDYAFIEFTDPRDADDARYSLNGRELDGSRISVEFAKGGPRGGGGSRGGGGGGGGGGGSRDYLGRGPPPGSGRCFNCGIDGHWARDCKAGDWKNKCYRCGDRGHIERNCQNSPKSLRSGHSHSPSPSPRRGRRNRSYSRSPSYSGSRSPAPRRNGRSVEREGRRSRSPKYSRSPKAKRSPPPSRGRKRSLSPDGRSPRYSRSPKATKRSPPSKAIERSISPDGSRSPPVKAKELSRSPSPSKVRERSLSPDGSRSPPPLKVRDGSRSPPPLKGRRDQSLSPGGRSPSVERRRHVDSDRSDRSVSPRSPAGGEENLSPERNGRSPSPGDGGDDDIRASPRGSVSSQD